jgi:crotonobetainyl-CoA:carnitine CoA-transferase CaiB-like acyl-CoA transferase
MLDRIHVLDLSRVLAGPICTMILGDLGARVIKVERPGTGDETRRWGPPFDDRGESAYYLSVNRNKKSLTADLSQPADRDLVIDLIEAADVVVDNFLPGALRRCGIDRSALVRSNPRLIWCTISGFGDDAPRAGYDLVVQAESGWMSITGDPDGPPTRVGVALADIIAGKDAAIAILAALAARGDRDTDDLPPAQRRIDISLIRSATAALINVAQNTLVTGEDAKRWGNQHPNLVPYQLFEAADRPFVIAVGTDSHWRAAMLALDLPELAQDIELSTNAGRIAERERIIRAIARRVNERPAEEWLALLTAVGVPCGRVNTVIEALESADASPLTGISPSVPGKVRMPPPMLGEHDEQIRRLGWSAFDWRPG